MNLNYQISGWFSQHYTMCFSAVKRLNPACLVQVWPFVISGADGWGQALEPVDGHCVPMEMDNKAMQRCNMFHHLLGSGAISPAQYGLCF